MANSLVRISLCVCTPAHFRFHSTFRPPSPHLLYPHSFSLSLEAGLRTVACALISFVRFSNPTHHTFRRGRFCAHSQATINHLRKYKLRISVHTSAGEIESVCTTETERVRASESVCENYASSAFARVVVVVRVRVHRQQMCAHTTQIWCIIKYAHTQISCMHCVDIYARRGETRTRCARRAEGLNFKDSHSHTHLTGVRQRRDNSKYLYAANWYY